MSLPGSMSSRRTPSNASMAAAKELSIYSIPAVKGFAGRQDLSLFAFIDNKHTL
jgi:hypothetical protein